MEKAILMGPFVGELYWETARFAPMLPYFKFKKFKGQKIKYIILTRRERFDLYGKYADILVPLNINGDYEKGRQPNCFRLNGYPQKEYTNLVANFRTNYAKRFNIIKYIYPDITKAKFLNKNQFSVNQMLYKFKPRDENYELVNNYIPENNRPIVILAPRFRRGFRRNWNNWQSFYDLIYNDKDLFESFRFIICGKVGEYIPDKKDRLFDMNKVSVEGKSSIVGLLLVLMERAVFVCGSQSAIPNIGLLYNIEVLEFGCQKKLHTVTYNVKNTPITFIDDKTYKIEATVLFNKMKKLLKKHKTKEK